MESIKEKIETNLPPRYGIIKDKNALGQLLRQHRRMQELTLKEFYQSSGITTRFMSELERGKIASIGRLLHVLRMLGLELVIVPRAKANAMMIRFLDA